MNKENVFGNKDDSDDEKKANLSLSDLDIDEINNEIIKMNSNYLSEEYSDDDVIYPSRGIDKMEKVMNNKNKKYESDEYSDDDCVYPNRLINSSSINNRNANDNWMLIEADRDQRPSVLQEFKEKIGPTFPVYPNFMPATFYKETLPDSLFDHIFMCTNSRIHVYFDKILLSTQNENTWKLVRLFSRLFPYLNLSFEISRDEVKKFFAIVVHMGMIRKRSICEYWSTDPYLTTPIFHSPHYLSRDPFF